MNIRCTIRSSAIEAIAVCCLWFALPVMSGQAQSPITSSGLNTQVSGPIAVGTQTQLNITGGTRPEGGTNLFHSFGNFNVPTNNIANFLNAGSVDLAGHPLAAGLPTSNILGSVTGVDPSIIFGTIQTNGTGGFGNANLFLMNPHGFLFGPNATVNVGGMVSFTTADYLRLDNGVLFNATRNAAADALLSAAPVAAFGFLGSNPAAIAVQGNILTVAPGQAISLVGGNRGFDYTDPDTGITAPASVPGGVTMTGGKLSATGGQINLASVASSGEILLAGLQSAPNINGQSFTAMGNISLSQGALLDVSADAAGTIRIRGGQFVIADATLSADTGNTNGASTSIDINISGDMTISDTRAVSAITSRTNGTGDAGEVRVVSANLNATSSDPEFAPFALIDAHSSGDGRAGNIHITSGNITVEGPAPSWNFTDSGQQAAGPGGDITFTAHTINLTGTSLSAGTQLAELTGFAPTGHSGNLTLTADSLHADEVILVTTAFVTPSASHYGGDIRLNVRNINMLDTQVGTDSAGGRGGITIKGDSLIADNTTFTTFTAFGPGGGITFEGRVIELINGSAFFTNTSGGPGANAGDIHVTATDHFSLIGKGGVNILGDTPTGLYTNSLGFIGTEGNAGNVFVSTPRLVLNEGRINTSTETSGAGGNVTINAGVIEISTEFPRPASGGSFVFTTNNIHPSGIFTQTVGSESCSGPCGNAGNINIMTDSLTMGNGSQINSGTTSSGQGGTITINATNQISMSGTLKDGSPVGVFSRTIGTDPGSGGGNISLTAGQSVTISNGASVSASSTGPGNTGNIQINAGNQFAMENSSVTTEANFASGGAIKITTTPSGTVELTDSTISASVLDGTGGGGSVNIDPQFVILQNSQILAQAKQGPGGNISITTNLLLPDANSVISASSQFGVNGTVTIQSPNAPGSGQVQPLGKTPLQATSLLNQHCAALAGGEFSSFTVAGRDSLPTEPGSWLASPLVAMSAGEGLGVRGEGREGMTLRASSAHETAWISLRQIAPAGFLTQAFAVDWSAGCRS